VCFRRRTEEEGILGVEGSKNLHQTEPKNQKWTRIAIIGAVIVILSLFIVGGVLLLNVSTSPPEIAREDSNTTGIAFVFIFDVIFNSVF